MKWIKKIFKKEEVVSEEASKIKEYIRLFVEHPMITDYIEKYMESVNQEYTDKSHYLISVIDFEFKPYDKLESNWIIPELIYENNFELEFSDEIYGDVVVKLNIFNADHTKPKITINLLFTDCVMLEGKINVNCNNLSIKERL